MQSEVQKTDKARLTSASLLPALECVGIEYHSTDDCAGTPVSRYHEALWTLSQESSGVP